MDATLSGMFLPLTQGGNAVQDAVATPRMNHYGSFNVHFGNSLNQALEKKAIIDQRKREGASDKGEPVEATRAALPIPMLALGLAALGFVVWRARK